MEEQHLRRGVEMSRTKEEILSELRYETPGEHTFSMCKCGRQGSRSYKCILCLKEELLELMNKRQNDIIKKIKIMQKEIDKILEEFK